MCTLFARIPGRAPESAQVGRKPGVKKLNDRKVDTELENLVFHALPALFKIIKRKLDQCRCKSN